MQINEKVMIKVAEPWDFTSPEGDNIFSGIVSNYTNSYVGVDSYLIKTSIPLKCDGNVVNYIVATYRNKNIDNKVMNIAYIPDNLISQFERLDTIKDKLKFIIIGSLI